MNFIKKMLSRKKLQVEEDDLNWDWRESNQDDYFQSGPNIYPNL